MVDACPRPASVSPRPRPARSTSAPPWWRSPTPWPRAALGGELAAAHRRHRRRADASRTRSGGSSTTCAWLGLELTGEPVRQSERRELHVAAAQRAAAPTAHAYRCFCPPLAGALQRRLRLAAAPEAARRLGAGERGLRCASACPRGDVSIPDAARGDVRVPGGEHRRLRDHALGRQANLQLRHRRGRARSMEITHVIRGEEHLANTARQGLLVIGALGLREPRYAHCALLLDEDGAKLTKRRGAESIADLRSGRLPARGARQLRRPARLPGARGLRRGGVARAARGCASSCRTCPRGPGALRAVPSSTG